MEYTLFPDKPIWWKSLSWARFVLAAHGLSRILAIGMEPDAELSFVQDYSGMCMHAHVHTQTHTPVHVLYVSVFMYL